MAVLTIEPAIPQRHDREQGPILVILFGNLFSDKAVQKEATREIDKRSRFVLTGRNHLWPTYVCLSAVEHDLYGNTGTATDIHEIATEAKANGWKTLVFFDQLSWRQHEGTITNYEDPTLSATVVNIECIPSEAVLCQETTFFIRRLPIATALAVSFLAEPQQPKDWSKVGQHAVDRAFQLHLQAGFYLYSPHKPMFGDERHVLASTSLDPRSHLKELVDTRVPLDHGRKRLLIQPLIHLQEEELASVHEQIQPGWEHERFIVGRWKRASPANRRDFAHILRHFSEASDRIIFLLNRPVIGEPLDTAVYEQHVHDMDSYKYGVLLRQNPEILKIWWQREPLYTAGSMSQLDKDLEFHVNPLMAFPLSLPAWYKALPLIEISRERDAGTSVPHNQRHGHSPAFYLTQSLNDEKKITAKDIIEKNNPLETGFTYIPWEGNVDGGPEDMLGAMKMVRYANRTGFTATQHEVLVFIDGQFKNDQKVIVCSWRYDDGGYSGIEYGRLDDDISNCLINVQIANMDMVDFIDEEDLEFYPDPDFVSVSQGEDDQSS